MPISVKINVDKVDKSRFFKGEKGRWLDLILLETPNSKYGDYLVKHAQTKEERQGGKNNLPILGNAKILRTRSNGPQKEEKQGFDDEEW
jgi:hypothetical protein